MTAKEKKTVRETLRSLHPDQLSCSREGIWTFKRSFFYRHGQSAEKYAAQIKAALPNATILETTESWASYPKSTYFIVRFRVEPKIELAQEA